MNVTKEEEEEEGGEEGEEEGGEANIKTGMKSERNEDSWSEVIEKAVFLPKQDLLLDKVFPLKKYFEWFQRMILLKSVREKSSFWSSKCITSCGKS